MDKRILLIEDNLEIRENTEEILKMAGYIVITAPDGKRGVELALDFVPDLIICDIMMPILDGYGVLEILSKNIKTQSIPFIFLTAKNERNDMRRGMEMGADDYLTKPFDDIELLVAIESRLKKNQRVKNSLTLDISGFVEFLSGRNNLAELSRLSDDFGKKHFKKKDNIYSEGSIPKGVFYIKSGKVKTYRMNDGGKILITQLYKEGDFFGYNDILKENDYCDYASALEDSEICLIPKLDFFSLIYQNSGIYQEFLGLILDNLRKKEDQLIEFAYNSVRKRIAGALIAINNEYKTSGEEKTGFSFSRMDLANISGTALETAMRTLSDFKEEGLIEIEGGIIRLKNLDKLEKMRN